MKLDPKNSTYTRNLKNLTLSCPSLFLEVDFSLKLPQFLPCAKKLAPQILDFNIDPV